MKKAIIGGLLAAGTLLGGLAITSTASADEPDVHHPECEGLVKDIPPGVPTPIDGDVYVKAGNDHYYVGTHGAGYVAGPQPEKDPKYDVSHVDVCPVPTKDDEVTYGDWTGAPECDETAYVETRSKTTVSFTWDGEEFIPGKPVVTQEQREVKVEKVEPCPTPPTPTTPTTPAPTIQVASQSPAAATPQAAAPAAATPAATLPSTGLDSTGITALLALLTTSLGGAALFAARRRGTVG